MPLPLYHLKQIQYWLVAGIYVLGVEKFSGGGYHWEVYLPVGWKYGGDTGKFLFDEKGRARVFVDYDARAEDPTSSFLTRYDHACYLGTQEEKHFVFDRINMKSLSLPYAEYKILTSIKVTYIGGKSSRDESEVHQGECVQWLNKNYPNWQDPFAYWDD